MTTSSSPAAPSPSRSSGESLSSLPRWRQILVVLCNTARHLGATLNWRRDPGYEQRMMQHKQRMQQLESDILRVRSDRERIESEILQIEKETEQL